MSRSLVTWEQTAALWRNLPGAARTAILFVAALAIGGSTLLLSDAPVAQGDYLFNGRSLSTQQLATMEAAWAKHGLSGYEIESGRVRAPAGQGARYLAALTEADALPADFGAELLSLSIDLNPFMSQAARGDALRIAKQNHLAKIIREMPDVEDAWVVVDTKSSGGLRRDEKTTASASVRGRDGAPLAPARLTQIQRLVASAVAGLHPREVAVIDLASPESGTLDTSVGAIDDEYLQRLQAYQQYYKTLVRDALRFVPGASVVVNVELDRRVREVHEQHTFGTPPPGATDGDAAIWTNVGRVALATFEGPGALSPSEPFKDFADGRRVQEHRRVEQAGLTPSRVAVSVAVPEDYFAGVWLHRLRAAGVADRVPTPEEQQTLEASETEKIRRAVAAVLPGGLSDEAAHSLVTVQPFAHGESPRSPAATPGAAQSPSSAASQTLPFDARLLGAFCATVLAFLLASALFRTSPAVVVEEPQEEEPAAPRGEPLRGPHMPRSSEPDAVEDHIRRQVDEDPEAALGVLRDWLHRGDGRRRAT